MTNEEIKQKLIQSGIKNLKTFGYYHVNNKNILTDEIYSYFFKCMLKENEGMASDDVSIAIDELIKEIESNKK